MHNKSKILLIVALLTGIVLVSYADRGISKKSRSKVSININTPHSFKADLSSNITSGLTYKGSLNSNSCKYCNHFDSNNLITYQKGNSVYILPVKQKVIYFDPESGSIGKRLIIKAS